LSIELQFSPSPDFKTICETFADYLSAPYQLSPASQTHVIFVLALPLGFLK
jgi:hypothetical protein